MAKFEISDVKMDAVPGKKTIEVETVLVDSNMTREEFYMFVSNIFEAVRTAEDNLYQKMRNAETECDNAEDKDAKHDWEWREKIYREKWHQYSDLENLFQNWLDAHKEWKGEEE